MAPTVYFASVTRLRLRSWRFLPLFAWHSARSLRQARRAPGCLGAAVRGGPSLVFWTKTVWTDSAAMAAFRGSGAHRKAMGGLRPWCSEASLAHWEAAGPPAWPEAEAKLAERGRLSPVLHPSPAQAAGQVLPRG